MITGIHAAVAVWMWIETAMQIQRLTPLHIINGELGTLQVTTYMCMVPDMNNELHASAFVYNIAKEQIKMAALQGRIRRQVPIPRLSIPNDESHVAKKQLLGMAYGMV